MKHRVSGLSVSALALTAFILTSMAPTGAGAQAIPGELDCSDEVNAESDECLLLPPIDDATNFVIGIAPLLAAGAGVALVAAAAGGGTATPSTSE